MKRKIQTRKTECKASKRRWCVLFGFKRNDHNETGCLAFRDEEEMRLNPRLGLYKIVKDISEAKHFPCENYLSASGFAPPEKWLEFFNSERELREWKFHLVKRMSTNEKNEIVKENANADKS